MSETRFLGTVEDQPAMATGGDDRLGATTIGAPSPGAGTATSFRTGGLHPPLSTYVVDFTGNSGLDPEILIGDLSKYNLATQVTLLHLSYHEILQQP